jgi:predicted DNA-binding protein
MTVITIRVPKEIKEKLEKYNVNTSEAVRELLDKYISELELKNLVERLESIKERLGVKIDPKMIAKLTHEDREVR